MKIVTDPGLIDRRRRQAVLSSLGGLVVLGIGLAVSLKWTHLVVYSYLALVIGTLLSWVGITLSDRWLRPPRADQALAEALKGTGPAYTLYNWVLPASHVLLTPWGLVVFAVFNQEWPVTVVGSQWREGRPLWHRLLAVGRRPVRNPRRLLDLEIGELRTALQADDPALAEVTIEPVVLFTRPGVSLSVTDAELPVLRADALRTWLREQRRPSRAPAQRRQLELALGHLAEARQAKVKDAD